MTGPAMCASWLTLSNEQLCSAQAQPSRWKTCPAGSLAGRMIPAPEGQLYREGLNAARKELISKALATTRGNRSAAAKILGLEAKYLFKLIKSLEIE